MSSRGSSRALHPGSWYRSRVAAVGLVVGLVLAPAVALAPAVGAVDVPFSSTTAATAPVMQDVVIVLKDQADISRIHPPGRRDRLAQIERTLRDHAALRQRPLLDVLTLLQARNQVGRIEPLWITNAISVSATPLALRVLARRPDVRSIDPDISIAAPAASTTQFAFDRRDDVDEPNIDAVNAPSLWSMGFTGQGIVVASLDTGVDVTHPDLAARWRGGSNSWFDPNGQHPATPTDVSGHGTQVMSVIVGGTAGGTAIGVAPGARWIAAKIFNDRGTTTTTAIHLAYQWVLNPDGDVATADAPNVVNNSWTLTASGCNLDFESDLEALRAAGILPVFAAGNAGPAAGTVLSPANNPAAFSVGSIAEDSTVDPSSSRGPSACTDLTAPSVSAPGVDIRAADLYGGYVSDTGTSVAAPHVAGTLALLLGAFPGLDADRQATALTAAAADIAAPGPDNDTGAGRLDALAAYQWLISAPDFVLSVSPGSTRITAGSVASYDVGVTAVNGFVGDVTVSASGLPSGATASVTPETVVGGIGTATVTVSTTVSTPPGTYALTVRGTAGTQTKTSSATLVVDGPPDFTVTASPASQTAAVGTVIHYAAQVGSQYGFVADVGLTVTGLPATVGTVAISPATISTAGTADLSVTVLAGAAVGTYPLTLTGSAGSLVHTTGLSLVVIRPDFTVSVTPTSRTASVGTVAQYTAQIGSLSGFTGNVGLTVSGLPTAVGTATVTPGSITGAGSAQISVSVRSTAPPGSYPLTVTGTSGGLTHTAGMTLVVTKPDFTLAASPSSVSVTRGQTASYALAVGRVSGFTGSVTLSTTGAPASSTVTFTVNPIGSNGSSSTLKVKTTTAVKKGSYAIVLTGKSGSLSHAVTLTLVVT